MNYTMADVKDKVVFPLNDGSRIDVLYVATCGRGHAISFYFRYDDPIFDTHQWLSGTKFVKLLNESAMPEGGFMAETKDRERLSKCVKRKPYTGLAGTLKLNGECPLCHKYSYQFRGRHKSCAACGYDRSEERIFDFARFAVKRNREVSDDLVTRALQYFDRVYGGGL